MLIATCAVFCGKFLATAVQGLISQKGWGIRPFRAGG